MEDIEIKDKNLCQCGCGEAIPFFVRSSGTPQRFKQYHHKRLKHGPYKHVIPPKDCACGCGIIIPSPPYPSYERKYIIGHNPRPIGKNAIKWKGGFYINNNGYRCIRKPEHPHNTNGYVLEHRLVLEAYLGRYLETSEHIHHINSNKQDNRIENLQLTTVSEHIKYHKPHTYRKT